MTGDRPRAPVAVALLAAAAAGCAPSTRPAAPVPTSGSDFFVAGYHPYWGGTAWNAYPWDVLTRLYYFEIEVDVDGSLRDMHGWPEEHVAMLAAARRAGVDVVPTVTMFDAAAFETLFGSPVATARLADELTALLDRDPELGGIHLDFEVFRPVPPLVRDGYTAFVARVASRLRERHPGRVLSVFTLAFDDADAFNERALAELADYLVVQGYDLHNLNDARSGPVAALDGWGRLNWDTIVDRFQGLGVPTRKIVMAVPLYGYEWPTASGAAGADTRGPGVTLPLAPPPDVVPDEPRGRELAARHGARRDPASGAVYYAYEDPTGWRQGWVEDDESLRAKYRFVRERGLGGVALFPLAYGDEAVWAGLREAFRLPRP